MIWYMLEADVRPWHTGAGDGITVELYVVTGRHGLLSIPDSFCEECHLFHHAASEAAGMVEAPVDIVVRSYWTRFLWPLIHGGYHPPVMLIDGQVLAQGHDVPDPERVVDRLRAVDTDRQQS